MKTKHGAAVAALMLCLAAPALAAEVPKEKVATMKATGAFDVKLTPQSVPEGFGRMTIDKTFTGDFEGKSQGEMLSAMSEVKGSGVYVAIDKVEGKLNGKSGSFVLVHRGVMTRGAPALEVTVVPDSGTGELKGLAGTLTIRIEAGGKHFYDFEYTLDPTPPAP